MVDYTTHPGRGKVVLPGKFSFLLTWLVERKTEKEKDLPVNDIAGLLALGGDK